MPSHIPQQKSSQAHWRTSSSPIASIAQPLESRIPLPLRSNQEYTVSATPSLLAFFSISSSFGKQPVLITR